MFPTGCLGTVFVRYGNKNNMPAKMRDYGGLMVDDTEM